MISTCSKCSQLYEAGSEEAAAEPDRACRRCFALALLLEVADGLVEWRRTTDIISGSTAGDRLGRLIDQAAAGAAVARHR